MNDRDLWPFDWAPPAPVEPPSPMAELERQAAAAMRAFEVSMAQVVEAWREVATQMARNFEQLAPVFAELRRQLAPLVEQSADPRARALYLRQTRNTGPALPRLDRRR